MDEKTVTAGSPEDKVLEGRLFELLEERAQIRLGDLARLRRQSRQRGVLLLDAAYQEGRLTPEQAELIAIAAEIEWFPPGPLTSSIDGGDSESSMFEDTMDSIIDGPPIQMNIGRESKDNPLQRAPISTVSVSRPPSLIGLAIASTPEDLLDRDSQANSTRHLIVGCAERISGLLGDATTPPELKLAGLAEAIGEALRLHGTLLALGKALVDDQEKIEKLVGDVLYQAQRADNRPLAQCLTSLLEPAESRNITGEARPIHAVLDVQVVGRPCTIEILDVKMKAGLIQLASRRIFDSAERVLIPLDTGHYILRCTDGQMRYQQPIQMEYDQDHTLEMTSPLPAMDLEHYALIPGGKVHLGADTLAWKSLGPREVFLGDFLLARQPVTCGEYRQFLNDLVEENDLDTAMQCAPRIDTDGLSAWPVVDGRFVLPETDHSGLRWSAGLPVVGIDYEDACRYCAWLDRQYGPGHRLPTEDEWEKAAGSRYAFPWGHRWNPEFCHTRKSTGGTPVRAPNGDFPKDESIYGVLGLAGGVSEWTASRPEDTAHRVVKGGHWASGTIECRTASRFSMDMDARTSSLGFRVARQLPNIPTS